MNDLESRYGSNYEELRLYPEQSQVIPTILGAIGAVIGVIPGCLLWVLLGRFGFVSTVTGMVMAVGVFAAYMFMSKLGGVDSPNKACFVICLIVIVAAVYISARIVYINNIVDAINEAIPQMKAECIQKLTEAGWSSEEISAQLTDEFIRDYLCEQFGIREITVSECSRKFSSLLEILELRGSYIMNIAECYLFSIVGIGVLAAKFK